MQLPLNLIMASLPVVTPLWEGLIECPGSTPGSRTTTQHLRVTAVPIEFESAVTTRLVVECESADVRGGSRWLTIGQDDDDRIPQGVIPPYGIHHHGFDTSVACMLAIRMALLTNHPAFCGKSVDEAGSVALNALKPTIERDGNQWLVLSGDNMQVGIYGLGDTEAEAIQAYYEKLGAELPRRTFLWRVETQETPEKQRVCLPC